MPKSSRVAFYPLGSLITREGKRRYSGTCDVGLISTGQPFCRAQSVATEPSLTMFLSLMDKKHRQFSENL